MDNEGVLPRHDLLADRHLAPGRKTPATGAEGLVQDAPVLDLGQVDDAVGLDLDVLHVDGAHEDRCRLGAEGRRRQAVEGLAPVDAVAIVADLGRGGQRRRRCRLGHGGKDGRRRVGGFGGRGDGGLLVAGALAGRQLARRQAIFPDDFLAEGRGRGEGGATGLGFGLEGCGAGRGARGGPQGRSRDQPEGPEGVWYPRGYHCCLVM